MNGEGAGSEICLLSHILKQLEEDGKSSTSICGKNTGDVVLRDGLTRTSNGARMLSYDMFVKRKDIVKPAPPPHSLLFEERSTLPKAALYSDS